MGASGKYEAEQEGFHGNPVSANQHCLTEGLSEHSIYHGQTSNKGGKRRAVNLLVKQWRKPAMMTKQNRIRLICKHGARQTLVATPYADLLKRPLHALTRGYLA